MFATNVVCLHDLGHASLTTIRRDFGHEFTGRKFPNPPPNSLFTYPNLCLNVVSMLSVACDLAVDFEVYTLTNSDNVCDECCVLHVPRTRISNDESS